jgi:hypothetical protein
MARTNCPTCARRLPYAARRCVHCGWNAALAGEVVPARPRPGRRFYLALCLLLGLGAAGLAYRNAGAISDWYASFAAYHLPAGASSFSPAETPTGAYFYCARQVARRVGGRFSVETFASEQESRTQDLGGGRYRVESSLSEAAEDGATRTVEFTCTAHFDAGRWALDELKVG